MFFGRACAAGVAHVAAQVVFRPKEVTPQFWPPCPRAARASTRAQTSQTDSRCMWDAACFFPREISSTRRSWHARCCESSLKTAPRLRARSRAVMRCCFRGLARGAHARARRRVRASWALCEWFSLNNCLRKGPYETLKKYTFARFDDTRFVIAPHLELAALLCLYVIAALSVLSDSSTFCPCSHRKILDSTLQKTANNAARNIDERSVSCRIVVTSFRLDIAQSLFAIIHDQRAIFTRTYPVRRV